jgi:hypothetical protein
MFIMGPGDSNERELENSIRTRSILESIKKNGFPKRSLKDKRSIYGAFVGMAAGFTLGWAAGFVFLAVIGLIIGGVLGTLAGSYTATLVEKNKQQK